jgi:hypothetical protein
MLIGPPTVESRADAPENAVAPASSLREVLVQLAMAFAGRLVEVALARDALRPRHRTTASSSSRWISRTATRRR